MAYSVVVAEGDGSTTQFAVNFALDYLLEADVTCQVGNEVDGSGAPLYRSITFLSTNLIQVGGAPAGDGVPVTFKRTVDKEELRVNFHDGDQMDEVNLDIAQKQLMMAVHEILDGRTNLPSEDIDVNGHKLINVAEPTDATDAATKGYADGLIPIGEANAAAAAASASDAADALASSEAARDAANTALAAAQAARDVAQTAASDAAATEAAVEAMLGTLTYATQAEAEAGTVNNKVMSPLRVAQAIAALSPAGGGASAYIVATDPAYGVVPGETDSSAKINLAIAAAKAAGGGQVRLPDGTFNIVANDILIDSSYIELVGNGIGTKIVLGVGRKLKMLHATVEIGKSAFRDMRITTVAGYATTDTNVHLINTRRCRVQRLFFEGLIGDAIGIGDSTHNSSGACIVDNWGTESAGSRRAIHFQNAASTGDHIVANNNFNGGPGGPFIKIEGGSVDGITMVGNEGTAFSQGFQLDGTSLSNATIDGNLFDCGTSTIPTIQLFLVSGAGLHNVAFSNNKINGYQASGTASLFDVVVPTGAAIQGFKVNDNQFSNSRGHGLSIAQTGSGAVHGLEVHSNSFDCGGRAATATYSAIFLSGNLPNLSVMGNTGWNIGQTWAHFIDLTAMSTTNLPVVIGNSASDCTGAIVDLNGTQQNLLTIYGNVGNTSGTDGGSPQMVQAWFNYNLATQTLVDSYNISSVTRSATGTASFTLANGLTGAGTCVGMARGGGYASGTLTSSSGGSVGSYDAAGVAYNSDNLHVVVYGRRAG